MPRLDAVYTGTNVLHYKTSVLTGVKKRDSSSLPILLLQLIRKACQGNLNPASAQKKHREYQKDYLFHSIIHIPILFARSIPPFLSIPINETALLSLGLWGATLMNSFLFNVALILLCSIRYNVFHVNCICGSACNYAQLCTIVVMWYNVFQIAFVALAGLTFVYYAAFGWRGKKLSGRFQLPS
ncbi:hypothetical protein CJ030_MR2G007772 [Morella rubra]|uniref:Uncharacterized protein n=1 Tax=Morella rubra TaxID=262757 RepID=A0A6A1WGH3_9ROSI|nr:hypothetical protein CJ030_MR2G007772 [Morella rubra]